MTEDFLAEVEDTKREIEESDIPNGAICWIDGATKMLAQVIKDVDENKEEYWECNACGILYPFGKVVSICNFCANNMDSNSTKRFKLDYYELKQKLASYQKELEK